MEIDSIVVCADLLSNWLEKYDRIFLVKDGTGEYENLTLHFCELIRTSESRQNILLLSATLPIDCSADNVIKIDTRMEEELIKLYHLYSFSDKFYVLAPSQNQGDVFNFIQSRQIDMKDVFLALIG